MKRLFSYLVVVCLISHVAVAQSNVKWTEKTAREWVNKGEWRHGLKLKLYDGLDYVEFAKQYHKNQAMWDKAFAYIRNTKLEDVPIGQYPIDGENVFAKITGGPNKDLEKTGWESHKQYIDLHLMITGKEKIGMALTTTASMTDPYSETSDMAHYKADGTFYTADSNTLLIFFPINAHRPGIRLDGYDTVKKLVIKVRVAK